MPWKLYSNHGGRDINLRPHWKSWLIRSEERTNQKLEALSYYYWYYYCKLLLFSSTAKKCLKRGLFETPQPCYNLSKFWRMEKQTTLTYFALEPFNVYNFPPDSDELPLVSPTPHPMRPSPIHLSQQPEPSYWTVTPPSNMPKSYLPRCSTPLPHCSEPSLFGFPNNEHHIPGIHFADDISAGFSKLPHSQFQELTDLTNSQTQSAPQAAPKSLPPLPTKNFFHRPTKRAREDTQPPYTATASQAKKAKTANCLQTPSLKEFLTGQSQSPIGLVPVVTFCVDKEERTLAEVEDIFVRFVFLSIWKFYFSKIQPTAQSRRANRIVLLHRHLPEQVRWACPRWCRSSITDSPWSDASSSSVQRRAGPRNLPIEYWEYGRELKTRDSGSSQTDCGRFVTVLKLYQTREFLIQKNSFQAWSHIIWKWETTSSRKRSRKSWSVN